MTSEMLKQEDSIPETWSRPDGDRFLRSPLATDGPVLVVSDLYLADISVIRMLKTAGSMEVLHGLMAIMYFVYDPDAPMYKHLDKASRIARVLDSHVEKTARKKVEKLMGSDEFNEFKSDYLKLVATPAQMMLRSFIDEVHDFVEKVNHSVEVKGEELRERIKVGKALLVDLEDLQTFVQKEGKSKTRGDYRPALFERRETAHSSQK